MKKKLLLFITLGILFSIIYYLASTKSYNQVIQTYKNESSAEYRPYTINGLEDYMFCVSKNQVEPYQQELLVLYQKKMWGLFNFNRYRIIERTESSAGQIVGTYFLQYEKEKEAVIFYSSNPAKISLYEIQFQENGIRGKLSGMVSQEESFVVGITEIGKSKYQYRKYDAALFYDEDNNIIEHQGNYVIE